jgi:hypothetical protein
VYVYNSILLQLLDCKIGRPNSEKNKVALTERDVCKCYVDCTLLSGFNVKIIVGYGEFALSMIVLMRVGK